MCYYYFMKDVIYIEPEDDITDIITKIENSKEKIVAIVPPKKAGVFRSVVNIKLIAKASTAADKTAVIVTVDPSIIKLAAATKLPVTKNLQTPPKIPTADDEIMEAAKEEVIDGPEEEEEAEDETAAKDAGDDADSKDKKSDKDKSEDIEDKEDLVASTVKEIEAEDKKEDEEDEEDDKKSDKSKKKDKKTPSKTGNKILDWIKSHKKLSIIAGVGIVVLIVFLIWAFVFAPAATVTVGIQTSSTNFSENVNFTTDSKSEDVKEGKFYIEERKVESKQDVKFEATGQKNNGAKASGELIVYYNFKEDGTIPISAGSGFTIGGLTFVSENAVSLSWDGQDWDDCDNKSSSASEQMKKGCQMSAKVSVTAAEPGTSYNISASSSGWSTTAPVGVYSEKAMSGGTDQMVTVVQQSDVEKAKAELASSNESENKSKLLESVPDEYMAIDSSFNQSTSDITSSPAVGEEVKDGEKPTLTATTKASVFVIEKSKVTEFIEEKAKIGDDQKVYEMKDPFIENFMGSGSEYTGRLKTSYAVGPKITENDVVEMVKGKGVGDAQHDLKTIDGVVDVKITTSFPWVSGVPSNTNKITINMEVKDQEQDKDKNQDKNKDKDKKE